MQKNTFLSCLKRCVVSVPLLIVGLIMFFSIKRSSFAYVNDPYIYAQITLGGIFLGTAFGFILAQFVNWIVDKTQQSSFRYRSSFGLVRRSVKPYSYKRKNDQYMV